MSSVSGVILSICCGEEEEADITPPPIAAINAWLREERHFPLTRLDEMVGGGKHPQILIYASGINYLDEDALAEMVLAQRWDSPENVVLLINPEEGPTKVFRPSQSSR